MNEKGKIAAALLLLLLFTLLLLLPSRSKGGELEDFGALKTADQEVLASEVNTYVDWFFRKAPRRLKRAKKYVPFVLYYSHKNSIDPLLTSVVISHESSWKPGVKSRRYANGHRALGLMQVRALARKGFNMRLPEGQIDAGTAWLRVCIDKCGSVLGGLNCYQTAGLCGPVHWRPKMRYRKYQKAKESFRRRDF